MSGVGMDDIPVDLGVFGFGNDDVMRIGFDFFDFFWFFGGG